jgi:hypothetical protein
MGRRVITPSGAILWLERQAFISVTARMEDLKLWSRLRSLLSTFESLGLSQNPKWSDWSDPDWQQAAADGMGAPIDSWAEMNGYCDAWIKEVGLYQLYRWSRESQFCPTTDISASVRAVLSDDEIQAITAELIDLKTRRSGLDPIETIVIPGSTPVDGLPGPFTLLACGWRPQHGQSWEDFAKGVRSQVTKSALATYKNECLSACPELAHLRGYAHYADLAKFQAGLLIGKIDETTLKRIKRTAQKLGVTLRRHRSCTPGVLKKDRLACEKESGGAEQAK